MLRIERKMDSVRVSEKFYEELQKVCDRRHSLTSAKDRFKNVKNSHDTPSTQAG